MGVIIAAVGTVLWLIGVIMLLVEAIKAGILWVLFVLLCHPIGPLVFIVVYWDKAKRGLGYYLLGIILAAVGTAIHGGPIWHRRASVPPPFHAVRA